MCFSSEISTSSYTISEVDSDIRGVHASGDATQSALHLLCKADSQQDPHRRDSRAHNASDARIRSHWNHIRKSIDEPWITVKAGTFINNEIFLSDNSE